VSRGAPGALNTALDLVRTENPALQLSVSEVDLGDLFITYQLQAGQGTPDAIFAPNDNAGDFYRSNLAADLSSELTADELSRFSPLALEASTIEGKLVQLPATLRMVAVYYRTDLMPSFPTTTDALLDAVRDGSIRLGLSQAIYQAFGFWGSFGGELMDSGGKCIADTTGAGAAYAYYAALKDAGARWYREPDGYQSLVADFNGGALDAIIDGPWAGDGYRAAHPNGVGVAPLPAGPAGPAKPMVSVDGWTINPHSANMQLALDFARRMTQPDIQAILSGQAIQIPADPSVQPADPLSAQFLAAAQAGTARPQVPQLAAFWGNFGDALGAVLDDGADPQQAVAAACAQMNSDNGL
jgi:maltose-binding protein MalE